MTSIIKIIIATVIGSLIGIERERANRPAGIRTHALVCIGAALVMDLNLQVVQNFSQFSQADPFRLGAQVISGIGFLGAGTILKEGVSVKGLTTAASIWSIACIGLVIGVGYYDIAIFAAFVIYIALRVFQFIERKFPNQTKYIFIVVTGDGNRKTLNDVTLHLQSIQAEIKGIEVNPKGEITEYRVKLLNDKRTDYQELCKTITGFDHVYFTNVDA